MNTQTKRRTGLLAGVCLAVVLMLLPLLSMGQGQLLVNLAGVDGVELMPENIFNYQIQSMRGSTETVQVRGRVVYRASGLSFSYTFPYTIRPGVNQIEASQVHPQWTFSSPALRELFMEYRKLPAGTYEYCVQVDLKGPGGELVDGAGSTECVYQKVNDVFLINLVDPENNAKLHEYYPVLSWMVNYPFASALTYRVRVAEVKEGQNNTAAVNRNNPVYQESGIMGTSVSYPVYARSLEAYQPYAWTVDAYYKGILLGGAEPWRFTIVEDSVLAAVPHQSSYLDISLETGKTVAYAVGVLKLKYDLKGMSQDSLTLKLIDGDQEIKLKRASLYAKSGDNRYELEFTDSPRLRHFKTYKLEIVNRRMTHYTILFRYINPDFIK